MKTKIEPTPFSKILKVPTSKSYANRLLVLAALRNEEITIIDHPESTDVIRMIQCLEEVGVRFGGDLEHIKVLNSFPSCEYSGMDHIDLHTGDGGTTNRFLIMMLALGNNEYELVPREKMIDRPMQALFDVINQLGGTAKLDGDTFKVKGPIKFESSVDVDCSESSQFYSAVKMVAPKDVTVNPMHLTSSHAYKEMTDKLVADCSESTTWRVPADYSSASYPIVLGLLSEGVCISNIFEKDQFQADSRIIDVLDQIGAEYSLDTNGLNIKKGVNLKPFEIDAAKCPDLIPALVFLAHGIEGTSVISNIDVLRPKESDRVDELVKIMETFEVDYQINEEVLKINGNLDKIETKNIVTANDHRMVMTAYLFLRYHNGGMLSGVEHINKSFPNFMEIMS